MSELLRKYLISSAIFRSPDDEGAANTGGTVDATAGDQSAAGGADKNAAGGDTAGGTPATTGDEKGEEQTEEEKAAAVRQAAWHKKRMNELGHALRLKERENVETKAQLAAKERELEQIRAQIAAEDTAGAGKDTTRPARTPAEIEQEIETRSEQKAAQKVALLSTSRESDRVYEEGVKKFGKEAMDAAASSYNPDNGGYGLREDLVEALIEIENAADVFVYYGKNQEELQELYRLNPVKLALKVEKMSAKLATPAPQRKAASNAPNPLKPIGGRGGNVDSTEPADGDSTQAWMEKREADLKRRGVRL